MPRRIIMQDFECSMKMPSYDSLDAYITQAFYVEYVMTEKKRRERRRRERLRQSGICEYIPYKESGLWADKCMSGHPAVADAITKSTKTISETLVAHVQLVFTEASATKSDGSLENGNREDCLTPVGVSGLSPSGRLGGRILPNSYRWWSPPPSPTSLSSSGNISGNVRIESNATFEDCT